MSSRTSLRLRCGGCARNLADVRRNVAAHIANGLQVELIPRPGVECDDYLPTDSLDLTFTIRCRCGYQHDRGERRLRNYWQQHASQTSARVVYAVLGRDL